MGLATTTLNVGTGGDKVLNDTLTTADGAAAPTGAVAQLIKVGHGAAGDFKTASTTNPLPVAGLADATASGSLAALNATVALSLAGGYSAAAAQITGTWVGTITFEASLDGTTWSAINAVSSSASSPQTTTTANGLYRLTPGGVQQIRANMSAFTSGSASILFRASTGVGGTFANQILPTRNLQDTSRSVRTITLDSFAVAATTETLNTMSYSTDNGALTTGTSYTVTTGKRLRIQAIVVALHTIAGNTTAAAVIVRLRVNNAGAAIVSSPVQLVIPVAGIAAANGATDMVLVAVPDGWEFVAGAGIGVTTTCAGFVTTTAAPKVDIGIIGFEY